MSTTDQTGETAPELGVDTPEGADTTAPQPAAGPTSAPAAPASSPPDPVGTAEDPKRWWTLAVLCLSLVLIVANNASLSVNLPDLQKALHASDSGLQWIVDIYSLIFAGLLLPAGALTDRYGRKTALQLGLIVLAVTSLVAMSATQAWELIALRGVMGAGAAFIMPGTLSILTNVFSPKERGKAIAIWAGFAGFGGILGPLVAGYLLDHYYWGSAFAVNVPIVAVALLAGAFLVPNSKDPHETKLDPAGTLLTVAGLTILLYGIIEGPDSGWRSGSVLATLAIGLILLAGFVVWELRNSDPMLDIRLFRNPNMAIGAGTIALQYFALYGLFFVILQYYQLSHGYLPFKSALATVPIGILSMVGAPLSARLVGKLGPRIVVGTGLLTSAAGFIILSRATPTTPLAVLIPGECLIGLGLGHTTAPSTTLIMSAVRRAKSGIGSAVNDTSRELGGALGIAVLGSILNSVYQGRVLHRVPPLPKPSVAAAVKTSVTTALQSAKSLPPQTARAVVHAAQLTFAQAFGAAMIGGAIMLAVTSGLVWKFQRSDRSSAPQEH
ncbi:MAG: DHA2 family efflux MFS transporter permease subunit [Actinomycetota bacterium]